MYSQNELKIRVDKDELVKTLKTNREIHAADYEKAKTGFRKLLIEELEDKLEEAKAGGKVELQFENAQPQNNLDDYDDVIGMLELSISDSVELSHVQYKQYVKNEWDWMKNWSMSNAMYLSAAL